jgi:CheY-like chemotaxis protein
LQGLAILVVEDNEANRLLLEEMLGSEGCRLVQAENGRKAVARVRETGPGGFDLVLMDVQMPEMDGYEATRRILALDPALPVVGLTAHALQSERQRCLDAGMVAHVAKPVELATLLSAVARYSRRGGGAAVAQTPAAASGGAAPEETAALDRIDWSDLLGRYAGRGDFLQRLVSAVLRTSADQPAQLRACTREGDLAKVAFIAHGLKGTAGGILPVPFQKLAAVAERAARDGDEAAPRLAGELADALEALLRELREWQERQRAATPPSQGLGEPERHRVSEVLEILERLLARDDTESVSVLKANGTLLRQVFGDDARQLKQLVDRFDYEAALALVRTLRARHSVRPAAGKGV